MRLRIVNLIMEFMGIGRQIEVLFLSSLGMPDILVCLGDDPVVGELPVGMFSVQPGTH